MKKIGTLKLSLKLSQQLLLLLVCIPLCAVGSLLYYSASQQVSIRNKPLEQLAVSTSTSVAEKIDRNLSERHSDVQAFALNALAVKALEGTLSQDSLLENHMNTLAGYYRYCDLMMVCDLQGKVLLLNTRDRNNQLLNSQFLKGRNMGDREWFRSSIVVGGPAGGAYFSDFNSDEEAGMICGHNGFGIDFSAPIKNAQGVIVGVWRNRVSWKEVIQNIRKESEEALHANAKGSLVLLMDKQGHLIDASQEDNILKIRLGKNNLFKHFDFVYAGTEINDQDFLYGWSESKGHRLYKGNQWKFLTLIPKAKFSDASLYLQSDWTPLMLFSVVLLCIGILCSLLFVRNFSKRLRKINQSVQNLSKGQPDTISIGKSRDEIGEMSMAINALSHNFKKMADFSKEIGEGNLTTTFSPLGEQDILGVSLLKMKTNLEISQRELAQQKWTSDTLRQFGELLRESHEQVVLYRKAISFLSRSIRAVQGVLFLTREREVLPEIELVTGYALSEFQLTQEPLNWGEGVVGQCIKDNEVMVLKHLPEEYSAKINSGLGASTPAIVLILPIRFNNKAIGAMEFSFFKEYEPAVLPFLEKISEYIGAYAAQLALTEQKERYQDQSSDKNYTELF